GLETSANDNADASSIVQGSFDSYLGPPPAGRITSTNGCANYFTDWLSSTQAWRNLTFSLGETPVNELSFFFYRALSDMPPWWQTGAPHSNGCGVDEASEAFHAVINWIRTNYGFYPEYATWNEPYPG